MNPIDPQWKSPTSEQAQIRTKFLMMGCLIAALGIGALLIHRTSGQRAAMVNGESAAREPGELSAGTLDVLQHLNSSVEIRFYALLDPVSVPESVKALAGRVDLLLAKYQRAADGRIKVTRYFSRSDPNAISAAKADGIKPFNLDKGDACYLGLMVVHKTQKESLPQLTTDWEQALEADLSRAIARLTSTSSSPTYTAVAPSQIDPAAFAEVKRQLPNFASISLAEGTQILREAALKDFQSAMSGMEVQLKEIEERLSRAQQNGSSEAVQQEARKHLGQVQSDLAEKLKEISAKSMIQIEALRQLKESAR